MFPTFGRVQRAGQVVPRHGRNFLKWRIHPIADKLGIPRKLVTFQVLRRTLGTDMQGHGTMKDAQQILRHASIKTTADVYMQEIQASVRAAINSRTRAIFNQRNRSDLKGKVLGKTEWLRQNVPDISKGTFYAALNAVKARNAEQERMMLGGTVLPQPKGRLTELQNAVISALVGQGYKSKDAVAMVKAAEGQNFDSLFRSAFAHRAGDGKGSEVSVEADEGKRGGEAGPGEEELNESVASESDADVTQTPQVQQPPTTAAAELQAALANEPDRDVASGMLTDYLRGVAKQFGNERIQIKDVSATVEFAARGHRIMPGDWLEKQEKDASPALCKCIGVADFMQRRRVQEWGGGKWGKEHVVFSQYERDYRVISESVARRFAPEAFPAPSPAKPREGL